MQDKIYSELSALKKELEEYANIQADIAKLHVAGELSRFSSGFMLKAFMFFILFIVLLLFSAALALFLGEILNSYIIGLLIIGGSYLLVALFVWLLRKPIFEKPAVRRFMHLMYPNTDSHEK